MSTNPDWPQGHERLVLSETDSTMAEALRRLPDLKAPTWILALRQTAGRGRRGRAWVDPSGNFAATLLQRLDEPPQQLALRSFVAALALHEALMGLTGLEAGFALKWPNDVLLNGGKLSGILLESPGQGVLSLGIGVNLRASPPADPAAAFPPVNLRTETGLTIQPEALLDHLAPAFATWDQRLRTYGFDPIRTAFLQRVTRLGQTLVARTMTEEVQGTFETIDATGSLVLRTAQGPRAIPAADIFFP
ncbi:biotin--[acetyl-CoA-carboxylase] ligase [Pararhodobacter zhoushanensis]|uniref:biotin--[biotin carboxyl-carrier protein] ligase n=1 Tax=Pararhodobacter zhoushanensis TaxID=2479545 RepID=A0ABT3GZF1_9RHOB|nr:biotin--[acetyl-CoA-carboxylase] ligase [Pararhodobacter zhoushanensis]MCW1932936.1 biotin--[acetyl-CoA-carboxylase] ligase [Pararhodobacter zhoushanensis]